MRVRGRGMGLGGTMYIAVWLHEGAVHVGEKYHSDYEANSGYMISERKVWDEDAPNYAEQWQAMKQEANETAIEIHSKSGLPIVFHWETGAVY